MRYALLRVTPCYALLLRAVTSPNACAHARRFLLSLLWYVIDRETYQGVTPCKSQQNAL